MYIYIHLRRYISVLLLLPFSLQFEGRNEEEI
jgi:hypothetical protein